jgi:hypothetical protein
MPGMNYLAFRSPTNFKNSQKKKKKRYNYYGDVPDPCFNTAPLGYNNATNYYPFLSSSFTTACTNSSNGNIACQTSTPVASVSGIISFFII